MPKLLSERKMRERCEGCSGTGAVSPGLFLQPCSGCQGTGWARVRCGQCWRWKPPLEFKGKKGGLNKRCNECTRKYANWGAKSLEERVAATNPRTHISADGPLRILFVEASSNRKTGPIPVSMTSARTCPRSCPLYNRGCYAEQHMVAIHWRRLSAGGGISWEEFVDRVAALPDGQLWRHNEAGDLPGDDGQIDGPLLQALVNANRGKRGFTYTHKPLTPANLRHVLRAVFDGFTVNISTDSPMDADAAAALNLPVVTVLPEDAPAKGNRTPAGRHIVVCPAELRKEVNCERCGLCAVANRKSIVGFRAHGDRRSQITTRLRQLPLL